MKKTIIFLTMAGLILSGCSFNINNTEQNEKIAELEQQLNEMKKELNSQKEEAVIEDTSKSDLEESKEPEVIQSNTNDMQASFIKITNLVDGEIFYEEPFYIIGSTSENCDKIVATAKNEEYGVNDVYPLQNYKRGNNTFKYGVKHEWNNLDAGKNTYTFSATCDGGKQEETINIFFQAGGGAEMGKPVIYLYPEREQKTFILPKPEGGVTVSEPALENGWNVTAYPNGNIVDQTGKEWSYLFWEGFSNLYTPAEGFFVLHSELSGFFDEKLGYLGLNENEITDFKEYWLTQLNEEKYYFISFISQEELNKHAPIQVEPKPDTVIRVFFDYKVYDAPFAFTEQKLEKGPERNGFTMTEWGGRLY